MTETPKDVFWAAVREGRSYEAARAAEDRARLALIDQSEAVPEDAGIDPVNNDTVYLGGVRMERGDGGWRLTENGESWIVRAAVSQWIGEPTVDDQLVDDDIRIPLAEVREEWACVDPAELERLRGIADRADKAQTWCGRHEMHRAITYIRTGETT